MTKTATRRGGVVAVALSALLIGSLTLHQGPGSSDRPPPCCDPTDLLLNVVLFLPLGAGLGLAGLGVVGSMVIGALASGSIETAQMWIPGRDPAIQDVLTNTLGTLLGALVVVHWHGRRRWWPPWGGAVGSIGILFCLAASPLTRPALPRKGIPWRVEWRPDIPGLWRFPGAITSFTMQGIELPEGPIANQARLWESMQADSVVARVQAVTGPPFPGQARLVGLFVGGPQQWHLVVHQQGNDLLVSRRLVLSQWGFRVPVLEVAHAFPADPGEAVSITITVSRDRIRATTTSSQGTRSSQMILRPELAWGAFLPFEYHPGNQGMPWTLLLVFGSMLAIGAGFAKRAWLPGVLCGLGVCAGPLVTGGPFPTIATLVGAAAGLALGSSLGAKALAAREVAGTSPDPPAAGPPRPTPAA